MRHPFVLLCGTAVALGLPGSMAAQHRMTVGDAFEAPLSPGTQVLLFSSSAEAKEEMLDVLRHTGLRPNFVFGRDDSFQNAAAFVDRNGRRVIAYNGNFMEAMRRNAGTDWARTQVLAHEVGHHVQGHLGSPGANTIEKQAEADEYSGFILHFMGATLEEAQSGITAFLPPGAERRIRLSAIAEGWNRARRVRGRGSSGSSAPPAERVSGRSEGAERAMDAIVRMEEALGDRLDEVEDVLRADLARASAELTGAIAESEARIASAITTSEARVIGAVEAGARETTEAIRAALAEEARLSREAIAAEGLLIRETVVSEGVQTRQEVNRLMWLLLGLTTVVVPMLLLLTFRKPRQEIVRVMERASTRVRGLGHRDGSPRSRSYRAGSAPSRAAHASRQAEPSPAAERPALVLAVPSGHRGGDIVVTERRLSRGFVIGRHAPAVDGVVDHPTVSRRHARITGGGSALHIEDLGSSNGTRVNGRQLTPRARQRIGPGDVVHLGGMSGLSVRSPSRRERGTR